MTILDEIQTSIRQHAEGAGSSVVGIGQRWGLGSGIVLAEGRVLTNAHNVRGDQVTVTFADGRTAEGSVAGQDLDGDLAVIEVDTGGAPALAWADGASAAIGTPVFALSNPGGRGLRVTFGFVSGVDRAFRGPRGRRITGTLPDRFRSRTHAADETTEVGVIIGASHSWSDPCGSTSPVNRWTPSRSAAAPCCAN